ncbi:hypothetical protein SAMN05661080_04393 [Modestobacter sp. DSM 44400]|uniref:hypothetical protein n=1 Tax=Modestobacter sp. DSM 44400 TaxID=1550230 RepID=UPI000898FA21|nr:hypothetical protein [Modestobacter sp. DSM 44400]SDY71953.1 hypothetical protein SAMN05661080_04393 [Modestobacter sp. DSM 44400]
MDLRQRLATVAVHRTSALVVEVPGWARTRWAVEREVRRRGWRLAVSPADADLLVTCGRPGPRLADALDLVWAQLPGPRARLDVPTSTAVADALNEAAAQLRDDERQRRDAADRPVEPAMGTPAEDDSTAEDDGDAQEDDDHGDMDMGGDHGDMDMDMEPGGIPLASGGGGDRDGLDLDVLHVPLGPVLPCWPPGLLLHCTLHGDVVAEARFEVLGAAAGSPPPRRTYRTPADRLDRAAQLLTLAGWDDAATQAARLRDDLLDAADPAFCVPVLDRLTRRVRRSRSLRWSLRGLGDGPGGDVWDRLLELLEEARAGLAGQQPAGSPTPVDVVPDLVAGLEFSAVRLVVASLDLDPTAQHHPHAVST